MISILKQTLCTNWHPMRWVALAIGSFLTIQAIVISDGLAGLIGAFFLFQAVFNTGCFGSRGCSVPDTEPVHSEYTESDEIEFTEIKEK